jgi:hypothetical protein
MLRTFAACSFAVIAFAVVSQPALAAECQGPLSYWALCSRCTVEANKTTKRDTPCEMGVNLWSNSALLSQHIIKPPAHGAAGISAANYAYRPAKGFVGRDSFTLERAITVGDRAYVMYVKVNIDVVP